MGTATFTAPDIVCQGCANAIKKALSNIEGVLEINVDVMVQTVQVRHDRQVEEAALVATLDRAGFPVRASQ